MTPYDYPDPHDPSRTIKVTAVHRSFGDRQCSPAGKTPTLLQAMGMPAHSTVKSFINAISRFLDGSIDYKTMIAVWSRRLANGKAS